MRTSLISLLVCAFFALSSPALARHYINDMPDIPAPGIFERGNTVCIFTAGNTDDQCFAFSAKEIVDGKRYRLNSSTKMLWFSASPNIVDVAYDPESNRLFILNGNYLIYYFGKAPIQPKIIEIIGQPTDKPPVEVFQLEEVPVLATPLAEYCTYVNNPLRHDFYDDAFDDGFLHTIPDGIIHEYNLEYDELCQ